MSVRWLEIRELGIDSEADKAFHKRADALGRKVKECLDLRSQLDRDVEALEAADPATFDASLCGVDLRRRLAWLAQQELAVRRDLLELDGDYRAELRRLADEAFEAHEAEQARIHKALLGIGYTEGPLHEDPYCVTPGMLQRHPKVHAALQRYNELREHSSDRSFTQHHEAAVKSLVETLEGIKARAVQAALL